MGIVDGRIAVVTGGAQGIGVEYARALAAEGASVVIADIQIDAAKETAARLVDDGLDVRALPVDVSDKQSTLQLAADVERELGGAHILVNNAAIYHSMRTDTPMNVDIDYWRKVFSVNLDGALLMAQAFGPLMIEAGWGRIVNQTSTAAYLGSAGHYGVSKLALVGLTKVLARELGKHGITVNAIAPGPIFTEATQLGINPDRIEAVVGAQAIPIRAQPEVLVGTLLHLCSDGAAWVTAQTLIVDGGGTDRL